MPAELFRFSFSKTVQPATLYWIVCCLSCHEKLDWKSARRSENSRCEYFMCGNTVSVVMQVYRVSGFPTPLDVLDISWTWWISPKQSENRTSLRAIHQEPPCLCFKTFKADDFNLLEVKTEVPSSVHCHFISLKIYVHLGPSGRMLLWLDTIGLYE